MSDGINADTARPRSERPRSPRHAQVLHALGAVPVADMPALIAQLSDDDVKRGAKGEDPADPKDGKDRPKLPAEVIKLFRLELVRRVNGGSQVKTTSVAAGGFPVGKLVFSAVFVGGVLWWLTRRKPAGRQSE